VLTTRIATAAVAIPALWLIVWGLPTTLFFAFILLVVALGLAEYMHMAIPEHPRYRAAGVICGLLVAVAVLRGPPWPVAALGGALVVGMLHALRPGAALDRAVPRVGIWMLGLVYLGYFTPHVALLREVAETGWCWVLFVVFTTMGSDTGGYFGGRWFGRRKLLPGVSPKKTIEGAVGAAVGALVIATACRLVLLPHRGWGEVLALGLVVSVLGQLGDLFESALKRAFAVKDSGWIVPGHGGILDRLDSLVLPFVAVYHYAAVAEFSVLR
jgi:phosphatidate cytidylyltransferase